MDLPTSEVQSTKEELPTFPDPNNFDDITSFLYEQIQLANYCDTTYDCVDAGSFCPFGCQNYVHRSRAKDIEVLMSKVEQTCMFDCGRTYALCKENKCEAIHYGP